MNASEVRRAILNRSKLFFCDGQERGISAIECVPVKMDEMGDNHVVCVFIPKGVKVVNVDAFLLSSTVEGAASAVAKRHAILAGLSAAGWEYAATQVSVSASVSSFQGDVVPEGSGEMN